MKGRGLKSPINGALVAYAGFDPGVNAWATEKLYDQIRSLPMTKRLRSLPLPQRPPGQHASECRILNRNLSVHDYEGHSHS